MKNWEFAFTGSWPAGIVFLIGVFAVGLAYVFYLRKKPQLPRRSFVILTALRVAAIVAAVLFLMKPVIRYSLEKTEQRQVIVLQDVSESMSIKDGFEGKSRLETGLSLLRSPPHRLLDKLSSAYALHLFSFGAFASEVAPTAALRADQKATAIGDALKDAVSRIGQQGLAAVVLLTDGVATAGEDPRNVARALGVPVFTVALGGKMVEKGKFHDVGIAGAPHNLELIVNNKANLKIKVSNFGLDEFSDSDRLLALTLRKRVLSGAEGKDEVLAETKVQFPKQNGSRVVEMEYVPKETGIQKLTVSLPILPGEPVAENNSRDFTVRVIDPKIRTLMVEGVVRNEYRFMRRVLGSDPTINLTSVIKLRKDEFLLQGVETAVDLGHGLPTKKEDYKKFDVVILGDIAREEFADEQLRLLRDFVSDGGGLLVIGGYHAYGPGGYANSPLADVLPVKIAGPADGQAEGSFTPRLTPLGKAHPVFEGCAEFFAEGKDFIFLDGANRVKGGKPGATVLMVHPQEKAGAEPLPIVAVHRYGSGQVLALTADTTWKWKFQIEGRGMESPYYRFWRQGIRWLAGRKEQFPTSKELVGAWSSKIEYPFGEKVFLEARVREKSGEPKENAVVEAQIQYPAPIRKEAPGGKPQTETSASFNLSHEPLSLGEYNGSFSPPMSGIYRGTVKASDKVGDLPAGRQAGLGKADFEFIVGQVAGEFDSVDVDEILLRAIAVETGGEFHTLATAAHIPEQLEKRRSRVVYREEKNLWNAPGFFIAFLSCVTLEWILRKRNALT